MAGERFLVVYTPWTGDTYMVPEEITGGVTYDAHESTGVHKIVSSAMFGYPGKPKGFRVNATRNPYIQDPAGLVPESTGYSSENYVYGSGGSSGSPIYNNTFALWYWDPYPSNVTRGPQMQPWPTGDFPYAPGGVYSGLSYGGSVRFDTSAADWTNWTAGLGVLGNINEVGNQYHLISHVVPEHASLYWVMHSGIGSVLTRWGGAYGASHPRYPSWTYSTGPMGNGMPWEPTRNPDVSVGF